MLAFPTALTNANHRKPAVEQSQASRRESRRVTPTAADETYAIREREFGLMVNCANRENPRTGVASSTGDTAFLASGGAFPTSLRWLAGPFK